MTARIGIRIPSVTLYEEVPEWPKGTVCKTDCRKVRGFDSHLPLCYFKYREYNQLDIDQYNKEGGNIWIISNGGRTGSHYLCHILNSMGFKPHFGEKYNIFSEWSKNYFEPLEKDKK